MHYRRIEPRSPAGKARILTLNHNPYNLINSPSTFIYKICIQVKNKTFVGGESNPVSRVPGANSTSEPPMLVTLTIYPAQSHIKYCIDVKNKGSIGWESIPGLPRGRREFYHWTTNDFKVSNYPCTFTYKILHSCKKQSLLWRGNEHQSSASQARILPLNHQWL